MTNSTSSNCPSCGLTIPENAPSGLCPACILGGAASNSKTESRFQTNSPPSIAKLAPHFPDLEILEVIGVGGMGAVYKARQPKLDREVALKILLLNDDDPAFEERFNREARVLARLNHPNIVNVFDFGNSGPYHFLIMEFVDGVNLRQAMQAGRFSSSEALTLIQDMCSALKSAHEDGILHRDIKPENILLDSRGRLKIADFGIAKLLHQNESNNLTLTRQDSILGSPQYMAPEQIESPDDVDQRADIYSLGVVFYELLTGELPLGRFAAPSTKNDLDARIDDIVFRTLEKEREARFQSAEEVNTSITTLSTPAKAPKDNEHVTPNGPARFATWSAFLTAVSLLAVILAVTIANTVSFGHPAIGVAPSGKTVSTNDFFAIVFYLLVALAVVTPLLGFVLGINALREIRESQGQKYGIHRSIFATVTWPILAILAIASLLLPGPMARSFFVVILLICFFVVCWAIVPPLHRWVIRQSDSLAQIWTRLALATVMPCILFLILLFLKTPIFKFQEPGNDEPIPEVQPPVLRDLPSRALSPSE